MPKDSRIKKVLVIGSGPIIIGQAAEFDYAGTQACRALKEEGIEVVLINSNPATIMTDKDIADRVYIEPLTVPVVKNLIIKEKPDSILPTLGGQNALNIAMALADEGFLDKHNVRTIGTSTNTIKLAEDRLEFKNLMEKIGEPCAASLVVNHVDDALEFARKIGYPVVVRPAYTLGGTGGGIAHNETQLHDICSNGLRLSRVNQCLIERCIAGWKEIEYEVMRDSAGNCITVCNMENVDPVGVHTGDSIVVAPSQTLGDKEYQMLRSSALNIITALNIEGGCNVQFALHPESFEYCVIEVNPRVSRSSALASKATGYPIAKLAAKIALGYTLDEIVNAVTGKTYASYEPTLDYIVCKIPKWPFDKFVDASRELGTQMKATGEVMSICNNFEGALMKALRSLEQNVYYEVYVNDAYLQIDLPQKEGNYTIDLSKYLCGGDNYIYIYTVDLDTEHYISVYEKTQVEVARNLPELASVGVYNERDKEYIQFGKYSVNGLTESEVDEIKYRVSVTNKSTGETQTKESTISRKDEVWNYIDISKFISTGTGIYEISIQALGYEKDKTTQLGDAITLRYGASAESKIEYVHKTYAETLELNVLVIDTEGNEREAEGGLEMSEMWLYFDMNLGEEYLSIAEELLFMLNINNRDYGIRIEYNNSYEGEVTGYVSTEDGVQIETRVVISRRTESGAEKVTISIEIIPMLKLGGFNIHKSGLVSMKARTEAQGNYFASNYQTKALEYEYMLRFKVPTGLEVVAREDGYYLKWNEPTHENIADYYSLIGSYTLQIESKGVANDGEYSDPHGTKGKVYRNEKVAREEILVEEGELYYYVGDKIFAGDNVITLKANGNADEYYLESQTSELEYTYIKRIEPVDYEINELASNRTDEKADKGVEIIIRDVYTEQAQIGGVNYNSEALYRVKITSTSQKMSEYPNPSEADYMDYEVSVVVNKNGIVEVESGNGSGISVRYVKNNDRSYLEIIWLMKESGYYTYEITGLGRAENSTKDGERAQGAIVLTYIAPQLEMGIKVYDGNGLRTSTKNKISKIVITWQSEISKFYGVEYEISITSSITQETKTIIVKNVTSLVINEGTNKDLYEWISNKPSNYTIRVRSLEVQAPQVEGSEEKITYYLEGQLKEKGYTYLLDINAPEEISIYEVGNKTYLKMKIPERIKQAGIETETNKIMD